MGLINYLARYVPHLATTMQPMSDLLKSDCTFTWDAPQRKAFEEVKQIISSRPTLAYYDINRPTVVSADASSIGLRPCIFQEVDGQLKTVAYASRVLTNTENRWVQIEREYL